MDSNMEEPMTELRLVLDSTYQCTQRGLNNDSGAGANAGSRAENMFVTANPLFELVWSPHKGLGLKCVDCSLAEKEPSFMWGMEPSNMVLSPAKRITARGATNDGPVAEGNSSSLQTAPYLDSKVSESVDLVRSPRSTVGIMPICWTMSHENNLGLGGDMEELTSKTEVPVLDINQEDGHSDKKEKGPDNGRTAESSSYKLDEPKLDLARVEQEYGDFNKGTSSDPSEGSRDSCSGNSHTACMTGVMASEVSTIKHCELPNTPMPILPPWDKKHEGLPSVIEEYSKRKMTTTGFTNVPPLEKWESTAENDLEPLKGASACTDVVMIVASQPADDVEHSPCQSEGILPKDEVTSVEASPNNSRIPLYRRTDKEKALTDGADNGRILKDEDDSHESIECCDRTGLFSSGKRPWSSEQRLIIGSKKMKKQSHESPYSASFCRQDSSFINWISSMMTGLSKFDPDETPLALTVTPPHRGHENHNHLFMLHGKNREPGCRSMGFQTIFNQGTHGNAEGHSALPNITSANITVIQGKHKNSTSTDNNSNNKACGFEKGGVSSFNSSFRKDSDSPSEGKEDYKLGSIDPNNSYSVTNRSSPFGRLWRTQFSPEVSGLVINSPCCTQNVGAAVKGFTDCTRLFSHSQNRVISIQDQRIFEHDQEPSTEDQMDIASKKMHNYVASTTNSSGSKRTRGHSDQKFKSTLRSIQPSQKFKISETMANVYARRLDALRHIIPSEVTGNPTRTATTCSFCGIKSHNLQDRSEITESKLRDILKNTKPYDGAEESSCLCIRCFQLSRWAIAHPHASSRKQSRLDSSASLDNFRNFCNPGNDTLANNDERNLSKNRDCQCQVGALTVSDRKNPKVDTGAMAHTNVNKKMSRMMILNERVSDLKTAKKDHLANYFSERTAGKNISREFILNGKHSASSSMESELEENQVTPICNFVNRPIPAVPTGIFEAIKRLRLSRTHILKWMKSPVSLFCLEGFFLRLRLGKWNAGLGGTGYYVACINGALEERSFGNSKIPLSVNVGDFKCLVENRFVSNHDFIEDELMAWWCATTKAGGKLLSKEDLEMKLKERKKFGF